MPPPRTDQDGDALSHFLGPWESHTVGSYEHGGWDEVDASLANLIYGPGIIDPITKLETITVIRRAARTYASEHSDTVRTMIGSCPKWVITSPVAHDYLNLFEDHDYSGTWAQWLDSLLMPGRWLDLGALVCIANAFDFAVFVVSAVNGELVVYHLGEIKRKDGRLIFLTLAHGQWGTILPREGYYWPNWWFRMEATVHSVDFFGGGASFTGGTCGSRQII
jgi:hypothetical protein